MFCRCPQCQTIHALNASLLARADGAVQCGQCRQAFNALAFLFDHWPDSDSNPRAWGTWSEPPVLGYVKPGGDPEPGKTNETASPDEGPGQDPNRMAWMTVFLLLLLITLSNLVWTFREPLMENAVVRDFLVATGVLEKKIAEPFRDVARIHLVSRDMHSHPARAGMLALSVTFLNRAEKTQPFPLIEVTLTDATNRPLARREFTPEEYLPTRNASQSGLAPNVHVPILLEFADPGSSAVGFELKFR